MRCPPHQRRYASAWECTPSLYGVNRIYVIASECQNWRTSKTVSTANKRTEHQNTIRMALPQRTQTACSSESGRAATERAPGEHPQSTRFLGLTVCRSLGE